MLATKVDKDFKSKDMLLTEAKALKSTLHELRKHLEQIVMTITAYEQKQDLSTYNENGDANFDQEVFQHEDQINHQETPAIATVPSQSVINSYERIKTSCVVVVGDMGKRGLRIADMLVRCGIRKLILFDNNDSINLVDTENSRWESEENPLFELESYVSNYEINEESFDHFLDRLSRGGNDENPVDLVILAGEADIESEQYNLIIRGAQSVGCPLLSTAISNDDSPMVVLHQPTGDILRINDGTTVSMIALELLLS